MKWRVWAALLTLVFLLPSSVQAKHPKPIRHTMRSFVTGYVWTGYRTSSGQWPRWGLVATDWHVVPPGSHMTISGLRGVFEAADTGGDIVGTRVDVFCWSLAQAYALTGWHTVIWY